MTLQYAPQLQSVGILYPSSHVIEKVVGQPFTLRWGARNNAPAGAMSGWVRLRVFESDPVRGPIVIGGINWVELPPGQQVVLDASGNVLPSWTQGSQISAILAIEGANSFDDVIAGNIFVVDSHTFLLTVNPSGPGPVLVSVGYPVIE